MSFIQKIAILLVTFMSLAISLDESEIYLIKGGPYDSRTVQDCGSMWCYFKDTRDYIGLSDLTNKECFASNYLRSFENGFRCQRSNVEFLAISKIMIPDKLPPVLKIKNLRFTLDESSTLNRVLELPDNTLLGGQSGFIEFDILNEGRGAAKGVVVKMKGSSNQESMILEIEDDASVKFPISAPLSTSDDIYNFTISVEDYNGFDAPSKSISINVREVSTPKFELASVKVDDDKEGESWGNNDGVINKGEAVEVTFMIKNTGNGDASNVVIRVQHKPESGFFLSEDQRLSHTISEFKARDSESFSFSFLTNKKMKGNKIPVTVKVSESSGEFGTELDLNLKIDKPSLGY